MKIKKTHSQKMLPQSVRFHKKTFFILVCMLGVYCYDTNNIILAQEQPNYELARQLLAAPPSESQKMISELSTEQAIEVSSQIRQLVRKENPAIDELYFLLQKLEAKRANDLAQERLQHLLAVLFLTLLLFLSFLLYVLWNQRKVYRQLTEKKP